jgi:hypothetical protein
VTGNPLDLPFMHEGRPGRVLVTSMPSTEPESIGKAPEHAGFPVCTATVELPASAGYLSFCGWVQLVRSNDNASGGREFEIDPLGPFDDSPSPYCFYGLAPTLFDAPSRDTRSDMSWVAHSFLAGTDLVDGRRGVVPLLGFAWGFEMAADGSIELQAPSMLELPRWDDHLPHLRRTYPSWAFAEAAG